MAELLTYGCPCCGGDIDCHPDAAKLICPSCGTSYEPDILESYAEELRTETADGSDMHWEEEPGCDWAPGETDGLRVFQCTACGSEIIAEEQTAAFSCPYCDAPMTENGSLSGQVRPDLVIPFQLDKAAAVQALLGYTEGKPLLPPKFRSMHHLEGIKGVYVPVWLFDTDANANLRYRAKRVKIWADEQNTYAETGFYDVIRAGSVGFAGVPVDGSEKLDDALMQSVEPFDLSQAVPFQRTYLTGYLTDKYDVDAQASIARANERIRRGILLEFEKTVQGYSGFDLQREHITLHNSRAKYALYPLWLLTTVWNEKHYTLAVNGQTGKCAGDLPADRSRANKLLLAVAAVTAVLIYVIGSLL